MSKKSLIVNIKPIFFQRSPIVRLSVNEQQIDVNFKQSEKVHEFVFDIDSTRENHQIKIVRSGKKDSDTLVENGEVVADQTVHIDSIVVDDVNLSNLLHLGKFYPEYPEPWASEQRAAGVQLPEVETYRQTLYHNGTWKLDFTMPIHIWFFNNINM